MTETAEGRQDVSTQPAPVRTKLIEVALPLEAINAASAREKSIRHGHPSTLHLWWARRPLAACRAVLFSQLVDDPSAVPEEFPTEEAQEAERQRLFRIIEELVKWENSTNETVLMAARREIARSVARGAGIPGPETDADVWRILTEHAPPVLDPFCGGGSIPLEAQRLGLKAYASDLNPVAVLITKALIEIPPTFAGQPPVNRRDRSKLGGESGWRGVAGLAEDVRHYGEWMRDEAFKRIGHLYPKAKLPNGGEATVIAWLWARTVTCPNPACGARMPLIRSFALSTKKGKETWVEPVVDHEAKTVRFEVKTREGTAPEGTMKNRAATCLVCGTTTPLPYIRMEAQKGRMHATPLATVAEGTRERVYLAPDGEHERIAKSAQPAWKPEEPVTNPSHDVDRLPMYGMPTWGDAFTPRQLVALTTFSDLVGEARERVRQDAVAASVQDDRVPLNEGGTGAVAYADAVATYLAFAVSRSASFWSTLAFWSSHTKDELVKGAFGRQALPMTWDFGEVNPFANSGGAFQTNLEFPIMALKATPHGVLRGHAEQRDARTGLGASVCVATDPPYYDNIGYADLSDFFYVWLRRSLRAVYPDLFRTLLVPKADELVATPYRFDGDKGAAERFFERGLSATFQRCLESQDQRFPLTIYYAFKQAETHEGIGTASTGWETILSSIVRAGFQVDGTWPMRTELTVALKKDMGALASSILLACRPRPAKSPIATRREFIVALREELAPAIKLLTRDNIPAIDVEQAIIGPGMRVFSRYARVIEATGESMPVRNALALINQIRAEIDEGMESEYDGDTRWAIAWYKEHGLSEGDFGRAEQLSKSKNTSVDGLRRAGIMLSPRASRVRLRRRDELPVGWDPLTDRRISVWEVMQHLIRCLETDGGEPAAAALLTKVGGVGEAAKGLAYSLFAVADRKKWTDEAAAFNSLAVAWPEITRLAAASGPAQAGLGLE